MNIIEAIKSGKPFKRKNADRWSSTIGYFSLEEVILDGVSYADAIADDWETDTPSDLHERVKILENKCRSMQTQINLMSTTVDSQLRAIRNDFERHSVIDYGTTNRTYSVPVGS